MDVVYYLGLIKSVNRSFKTLQTILKEIFHLEMFSFRDILSTRNLLLIYRHIGSVIVYRHFWNVYFSLDSFRDQKRIDSIK